MDGNPEHQPEPSREEQGLLGPETPGTDPMPVDLGGPIIVQHAVISPDGKTVQSEFKAQEIQPGATHALAFTRKDLKRMMNMLKKGRPEKVFVTYRFLHSDRVPTSAARVCETPEEAEALKTKLDRITKGGDK
jgi:hypothetical protein